MKNREKYLKMHNHRWRTLVKDNSKVEFDELKKAIERYNNKVERIMESHLVKDENRKILSAKKDMIDSFKIAANHYFKEKEKIFKNHDFSEKEKKRLDYKLYNGILDSFLTNDEKDDFEKMIKYVSNEVHNKKRDIENNKHNKIEFNPKLYRK